MNLVSLRKAAAISLCCFLSGAAGLIYEVVWARYLALYLGHTGYAVVVVLAVFMGGLALGNLWLGGRADQAGRPLALYGWLEIGIAACGLTFPLYDTACHRLFGALARGWEPGGAGLLALQFVFSAFTILLPTLLMGGTLPILARVVTRSLGELRPRVAGLYSINSAGAVAGCLLADFWWVPVYGLQLALLVGAALNLTAGVVALLAQYLVKKEKSESNLPPEPAGEERFSGAELKLCAVAIGLSGFVAMLYEVTWTRLLSLVVGSSSHAFSVMLVTFIAGIAAGAWWVSRWKRLPNAMAAFAWAELALGGTLLGSMFFDGDLPYFFAQLSNLLSRQPQAYPVYVCLQGMVCFAVMFLPAICLGITLPLATRISSREVADTGRTVGRTFSINTLGTVVGAVTTGLWLMPWLGMARTFGLGIAVNAVVGVVLLKRKFFAQRPIFMFLIPLFVWGCCWLAGLTFADSWQRSFTLGTWREPDSVHNRAEFRAVAKENNLKFYRDGAGATVSVNAWTDQGLDHLTLRVNGKPDASTTGDVATQLLLGHLPMLLKPDSQEALVIGLGSGMTCGAVACHSAIRRIDAVEILPEAVSAARLFADHNGRVLEDARLKLVVEDAKTFLQITDRNYDIIISEPSNPWMAGVAGVFTREFYADCRSHLRTHGLMAQWIHLYENSDEALDLVLRTFSSIFPAMSVWQSRDADLILIGSPAPPEIDWPAMEAGFQQPKVRADLDRIQLTRLPTLLAREVIPVENGRFVPAPGGRIHTDLEPVLDYAAQKAFFVHRRAERWRAFDQNYSPRATTLLAHYLKSHPLEGDDFQSFARFHFAQGLPKPELIRSLFHRWQRDLPSSSELVEWSAQLSEPGPAYELEALRLAPLREAIFKRAEKNPQLLRQYARLLLLTYRSQRSIFYTPPANELKAGLERLIQTDPLNERSYKLQLAELAWDLGDDAACIRLSQSALGPVSPVTSPFVFDPNFRVPTDALARLVAALLQAERVEDAWTLCERARQFGYTDPLIEMACQKVSAARNRRVTRDH